MSDCVLFVSAIFLYPFASNVTITKFFYSRIPHYITIDQNCAILVMVSSMKVHLTETVQEMIPPGFKLLMRESVYKSAMF